MTKRLACILTAIAAGACVYAPAASAYLSGDSFEEITATNATFGGGNVLNLTAHKDNAPGSVLTGSFSVTGTDAKGTHSLSGLVDCMQIDLSGGAVLAHQTSSSGEPASVYGVLLHVTDLEPQGTNTGTGDKVAVTMLNQKQYQRALTSGCTAAAGRQSLSAGNITLDLRLGGIIIIGCPPFCGLPL